MLKLLLADKFNRNIGLHSDPNIIPNIFPSSDLDDDIPT